MQPAVRPQVPSQGTRPIRPYPVSGPMSSGLPPPQRPPAGYRPTMPTGTTIPPVQKMAEMNLGTQNIANSDNRSLNFSHGQYSSLSNGIPESKSSVQPSMDHQDGQNQNFHSGQITSFPDNQNEKFSRYPVNTPMSVPGSISHNIGQVQQEKRAPATFNKFPSHDLPGSEMTGMYPHASVAAPQPFTTTPTSSMPASSMPASSPRPPSSSPSVFTGSGISPANSQSLSTNSGIPVTPNSVSPGAPVNQFLPPAIGTGPRHFDSVVQSPGLVATHPMMSATSVVDGSQSPGVNQMHPQSSFSVSPGMVAPSPVPRTQLSQTGFPPPGQSMLPPRPLRHVPPPSNMVPPGISPQHSRMISPQTGIGQQTSPFRPPHPGNPPMSSQMTPGMQHGSSQMRSPLMPPSPYPGMPPTPGLPPSSNKLVNSPNITSQMSPGSVTSPVSPGPPGLSSTPIGQGMSSSMSNLPPGQHPQASVGGMQNRYPGAAPGGGGGYPQGQGRRLNPDDMPSPLQVMDEDRQCKSGEFFTNLKGSVPPLVTTDFIVKDGGNASPRFLRSTMYNVPATPDMMKQASVPFGLVISPLADLRPDESPVYLGTSLANGPVRCLRCKGYMSPHMVFMNGGRRFQCLLCKHINEVPPEYHCHMDSQGARADKFQRPELCLGSYEYVATAEYCKDKILPKEPAFIFVMEMSQMMVQRGVINILCQNMKSILKHLPKDQVPTTEEATKSPIRVGFITYDSSVHFYKLDGLAPEMCVLCDKEDLFVPVPDGVLCDPETVSDNIDKLMECIPQTFQTTRETSGALYGAIQAGMSALKASGRAGKLIVFHSSLPICEGPGRLKNREDRKVLGTEKEKSILTPQSTQYNTLAQDLVSAGCGVDLYLFNESYIDLATIGQISRLTGGQSFKYTFFQPNRDAQRLLADVKVNIGRDIVFDAVMRVRTSTGVRPVEFYGHFFMTNTQDIELACIDANKAVAVEIKHDDKITEEDGVYVQVALLYTSIGGQRRLRILNLAMNVCTQMADLYKNCDLDTLMNFFGKQSVFKFLESTAKQMKENLIARTAQILACYRKNCATPSSAGQLILPELMKLLPLYINCLTKCDAISGGQDMTCDDRSWHMYQLNTMTVEASVVYFYPRLIPLTNIDLQETDIPPPLRTSYEKLCPDGSFLLENGLFIFLWVGSGTPSTWMNDVFGVSAPHQLDPILSELSELDNLTSKRVRGIISAVREQRKHHLRLFVVPQQGKHEIVMRNYLVEDKGIYGSPSYVDFLCHVHKEIRALLS